TSPGVSWWPSIPGRGLPVALGRQRLGRRCEIAAVFEQGIGGEERVGGVSLEGGRIGAEHVQQPAPTIIRGGTGAGLGFPRSSPVLRLSSPADECPAMGFEQGGPVGPRIIGVAWADLWALRH